MWSNHDKNNNNIPVRQFSTPPASWKSQQQQHSPAVVMPMSERKSNCVKRDIFHVVHKVPSGDSPYVRAKHVQLIDKDPSRAISLFWAAINAGDRVDSALKDMAVVMKQLDRSDEAIEAIKSFRHLCTYDSQESLDNVLVELYKRSGRIEEEIEILHCKLKNIEDGTAFSGKRTKTARSQGKKVQITVEQEKSRILGNLAWAYLQHHDYGLAEHYYRKALSLERDYNKQCNLALCLMHMKRIHEAKSLLQAVSASCGSKPMDESYAKSFERALEMLNDLESHSLVKTVEEEKENQRSLASPAITGPIHSRGLKNGENKEHVQSDRYNRGSNYENHPENQRNLFEYNNGGPNFISSGTRGDSGVDSNWRKGHTFESPHESSGFFSRMKENWTGSAGKERGSTHKKMLASPAAVLYTQPRSTQPRSGSWRFSEGGQRKVRWEEDDTIERSSHNLLAHAIRNLNGELQDSTDYKSEAAGSRAQSFLVSPAERNWRGKPQTGFAQVKSAGVPALDPVSQPRVEGNILRRCSGYDDCREDQTKVGHEPGSFEASIGKGQQTPAINVHSEVKLTDSVGDNCTGKSNLIKSAVKSWADMAEEEERKLINGEEDLSPYFGSWNYEEECSDENLDFNIVHHSPSSKSPVEAISQKFEAFDLKDGYDSNAASPRNPTVRRSLRFDSKKDSPMRKKHRLQVFRDITPNPDSP